MVKNEGIKALERLIASHLISDSYGKEAFEKDYTLVKNMLEANDVLRIIFEKPFIIEDLFQLGKLGKKAQQRYMWGTITNKDVKTVEEFFKDEEQKRNKSK